MRAKFLSGLVILALALAAPAYPAETPKSVASTYTIDGITYYNVNSSNFNSDKRFYVDVVSAKHSALGDRSLGDLWLMAAAGLGTDVVRTGVATGFASDYLDKLKEGLSNGKIDYDYSAIQYYDYSYSAPAWSNSGGGYVETSAKISGRGAFYEGTVKYTVRFSDFTVGALLPADEGLYVATTTENGNKDKENVEASSVKNDTNTTVTTSQTITKSTTESLTNTVDHSSSYSFTEGLKIATETSGKALFATFKITGELSTSFTQAFTDGWSKSKGITKSYQKSSEVSVTLPPYTNVMIKQGNSKTTTTTKYNCPVIVGYKVTILIDQTVNGIYTYTFGESNSNARKDLNHRAFEEGAKNLDSQSIDWPKILSDSQVKDAITKITTHAPMSGSGATTVYTIDTTYSEVAGLAALYPLTRVELGHATLPFIDNYNVANMKVGEYSYLDYLYVNGYNSRNAEYYGFDKNKGYWKVVDEHMRELSDSDAPVTLTKDSATGYTQFKAVKPGKCYLKYFINENAYPTGSGSNTYTKNADIQPAMLEINVAEEEVTYKITGSYTGIIGFVSDDLEGNGKLSVSAYNTEDIEVEREYIWQKQELTSKGIRLDDNGIVTLTKKGPFHVRVKDKNGKIHSDWVLITAIGLGGDESEVPETDMPAPTEYAEVGTTFMISGKYVGGVSNDAENIEGFGKLSVTAYEPTGMEQNVLYSWEARDDSDGMTLTDDGTVKFTRTGKYYVRVKSGEVYSQWIEITANEKAPARFTHLASPVLNTYNGEAIQLIDIDTTCEGGTAVYALGSDGVTAPTSYSSERPTAVEVGTYYVWCKVLGDENHDNSEPVCVVATIREKTSAPETEAETETKTDGGLTVDNSSSGGCDSGMSALVLGVMFAALMLRRKTR